MSHESRLQGLGVAASLLWWKLAPQPAAWPCGSLLAVSVLLALVLRPRFPRLVFGLLALTIATSPGVLRILPLPPAPPPEQASAIAETLQARFLDLERALAEWSHSVAADSRVREILLQYSKESLPQA